MWKKIRKKLDLPESYISITLGFLVILVAGILTYNNLVKNKIQVTQNTPLQIKNQSEEQKMAKNDLPSTYTVSAGDTLWKIADKYYKSGYNWVTLASANKISNPDKIEAGQKLSIPKAETIKPGGNILATQAPPKDYTVVKGDSLWKIAVAEYGTGYAWTKIAETNKLANPNLIFAGNVLRLPR